VQAGDRLVFRPTEEGLSIVLPFITKRRVDAAHEDFDRILSAPTSQNGQAHQLDVFSSEFQRHVTAMRDTSDVGPMLMVASNADAATQALPVWVGDKAIVLLLDKDAQKRLAMAMHQ
jgi:hypothetical protein